jgi:hypothetical protein
MIMSGIHHIPAKAEWDRYETARRAMSQDFERQPSPPLQRAPTQAAERIAGCNV